MTRLPILLALAGAVWLWGRVPEPKQRWEVRLSTITAEAVAPLERPIHPVVGLRFSPDGKWIAAAVTHDRSSQSEKPDELVVLPVDGNEAAARRFAIPETINGGTESPGVYWAPSGEHIALETTGLSAVVLDLSDGKQCKIPQTVWRVGGFVDDRRVLISDHTKPKNPRSFTINSSPVSIYGPDCALVASWDFRGRIDFVEAYSPAGAVAINPDRSEIRMLAAQTGALLQKFPLIAGLTSLRFGAKGEVLCAGRYPAQGELGCYSTRGGSKIARHPTIKGGGPFDVSVDNTLVLASDGVEHYNAFTERTRDEWKAWVVWDFRSGRDVARLKYRLQRTGLKIGKKEQEIPFAAAISPDGRCFAVAGDDAVQLYDIPR